MEFRRSTWLGCWDETLMYWLVKVDRMCLSEAKTKVDWSFFSIASKLLL